MLEQVFKKYTRYQIAEICGITYRGVQKWITNNKITSTDLAKLGYGLVDLHPYVFYSFVITKDCIDDILTKVKIPKSFNIKFRVIDEKGCVYIEGMQDIVDNSPDKHNRTEEVGIAPLTWVLNNIDCEEDEYLELQHYNGGKWKAFVYEVGR